MYALDYREYRQMGLKAFAQQYAVQNVIFIPNLSAVQSQNVVSMPEYLIR